MVTIYFDLDGVLADFVGNASKRTGVDIGKVSMSEFRKKYKDELVNSDDFFYTMDLMPNAKRMFNSAKELGNIKILSAYGDINKKSVMVQKQRWVRKHFGNVPIILVRKSFMKAKYANETSILVDDRKDKSIDPFVRKGGKGVWFKDAITAMLDIKKEVGKISVD